MDKFYLKNNMKIGIIYCGYNTEEYVKDTIAPWIKAKQRYDMIISAVSVPFEEYLGLDQGKDETTNILIDLLKENKIDSLYTDPKYVKESMARNFCLFNLLDKKCDLVVLVDSDEFYTDKDIDKLIDYINNTPQYDCYEVHLKNYVFDGTYWVDGFHPFRAFRNDRNMGINQFYWDNDLIFNNGKTHKYTNYITIPKDILHIKHMTWLNNEKSKLKVQYHLKHFGGCSYKWDEASNKLEFDLDYYDRCGYERPRIYKDEN